MEEKLLVKTKSGVRKGSRSGIKPRICIKHKICTVILTPLCSVPLAATTGQGQGQTCLGLISARPPPVSPRFRSAPRSAQHRRPPAVPGPRWWLFPYSGPLPAGRPRSRPAPPRCSAPLPPQAAPPPGSAPGPCPGAVSAALFPRPTPLYDSRWRLCGRSRCRKASRGAPRAEPGWSPECGRGGHGECGRAWPGGSRRRSRGPLVYGPAAPKPFPGPRSAARPWPCPAALGRAGRALPAQAAAGPQSPAPAPVPSAGKAGSRSPRTAGASRPTPTPLPAAPALLWPCPWGHSGQRCQSKSSSSCLSPFTLFSTYIPVRPAVEIAGWAFFLW